MKVELELAVSISQPRLMSKSCLAGICGLHFKKKGELYRSSTPLLLLFCSAWCWLHRDVHFCSFCGRGLVLLKKYVRSKRMCRLKVVESLSVSKAT